MSPMGRFTYRIQIMDEDWYLTNISRCVRAPQVSVHIFPGMLRMLLLPSMLSDLKFIISQREQIILYKLA